MSDDRNARVREHAYRLWQQEGEPHGRDRDHWEQAEREVGSDDAALDEAPSPSPTSQAEVATSAPVTAEPPALSGNAGGKTAPTARPAAAKAQAGRDAPAKKPAGRRKRAE